jgi:hypothetical protein
MNFNLGRVYFNLALDTRWSPFTAISYLCQQANIQLWSAGSQRIRVRQ